MARQRRIEFEGAYYHILSRGNERMDIFADDQDRVSFLEILREMSERFDIEVYAYVLMNNHYHLQEEKRIWEGFHHGLFFGSQKFIDCIKSKHLSERSDVELPQKRQVLRETNPETILNKAAKVLKCNVNDFFQSSRISDSTNKLNCDLLIYLLWSTGWYTNQEIGDLFGLGYSSISRRVTIMKSKLSKEDEINKRFEKVKAIMLEMAY